jgi:hypothetical protein
MQGSRNTCTLALRQRQEAGMLGLLLPRAELTGLLQAT